MNERWVLVPMLAHFGGGTTTVATGDGFGSGAFFGGGGTNGSADGDHGGGTTGERWCEDSTGGGLGNGELIPRGPS